MIESNGPDELEELPEKVDGDVEAAAEVAPTAEEVQELKDRLLRTLAEMENVRSRTQREMEDARKFAVTGFARDLLEVGDNLGRALAAVPPEARQQSEFMKNLVQGVEMTERSLRAALEKHQVRRVSPQRGERFDHKLHQAMFEVPSADLGPGSVAEVVQDGYVIADRLLRPALVGVAKATTADPPQGRKIDTSA
jgi:molecular chaperone GrpE